MPRGNARGASPFVEWGGRLVPRGVFEPPMDITPGACVVCGGIGVVPETIDEERHDVMVPCWKCRPICQRCKKYGGKGHVCEAATETITPQEQR